MKTIILRPTEPERDFAQLAAMFTILEDQLNTEQGLEEYYEQRRGQIIGKVAQDEQGGLPGFYWAVRDKSKPERVEISLFVRPEQRRQGLGGRLYADMEQVLQEAQVKTLRVNIRDDCPEDLAFAERRGFAKRGHQIAMALDLAAFDDRPYEAVIDRLKGEGFRFTSMEELGNTEEAQHKLYVLNDTTASTTPGSEGEHSWVSFEDFQASVCRADWYQPAGQMVVIDDATGCWAAMSAITRLEGRDHAYNLFTGVDMPYRGRKLAQAVKVVALRYAREVLGANRVRTHHNSLNLPMIAIDQKFGYVQTPGTFWMEKPLRVG